MFSIPHPHNLLPDLHSHRDNWERECERYICLVCHILDLFLSPLEALGNMLVNQSRVKWNENVSPHYRRYCDYIFVQFLNIDCGLSLWRGNFFLASNCLVTFGSCTCLIVLAQKCNAWFTFLLRQHKMRQEQGFEGYIHLFCHILNLFLSHLEALGKMLVNQSQVKGNENVSTLSRSSHTRV